MTTPVRLIGLAVATLCIASASGAQTSQPTAVRGSIGGLVVDAATLAPLENSTVALMAATGLGAFPPGRDGSAFFDAARVVSTSRDGSYEFFDVPFGTYRLYVRRLGYEPATVDIDLNSATASPLSVGLKVVPVRLRAMRVQPSDGARVANLSFPPLGTAGSDSVAEAARLRQGRFLGSDVREITRAEVLGAATLGGPDLFRALQRLPGVSSYDDWSPELWVRGSRWDQARVYFDGLPLLEPLHAQGTVTGIGSDALGSAILHPSVRPVFIGGEGVALLDLQSRSGGGNGRIRGSAGLSANDIGLTLDQAPFGGRAAWMVAARSSSSNLIPYVAWLTGGRLVQNSSFTEVVARGDADLGTVGKFEASGLVTRDLPYSPYRDYRLGNAAGRATLRLALGPVTTSHTFGMTRFDSRTPESTLEAMAALSTGFFNSGIGALQMRSGADYTAFSGEVRPSQSGNESWSAGYGVVSERANFSAPAFVLSLNDLVETERAEDERLTYGTLWADRRWRLGSALTFDGGLRIDAGGKIVGAPVVRPAASFQARYDLGRSTMLSAGIGRSFQYIQELSKLSRWSISPAGVWLAASETTPHVRNDQANAGIERWTGAGVLMAANVYTRRSVGIVTPDPRPGVVTGRSLFVDASESASGFELSARRLSGSLTGSVAYSFGRATRTSQGLTYDAPGDRRHALDATALVRFRAFRVGTGFSAMSGLPYSYEQGGTIIADSANPGQFVRGDTIVFGAPNARRFPGYASLDVMADWTRTIRSATLTAFIQIPNALGRRNLVWYLPNAHCVDQGVRHACNSEDLLYNAVPRQFPSLGFRIAF